MIWNLWEKTEFFSELKQSVVNDDDCENSKYLFRTLKLRNLCDLSDLYNVQDVILLYEIIENCFQAVQDTYGFNNRKYNSSSSMSGCIAREMSKIVLALPTKYEHVEIFEQTLIGGFSSVNTRLDFDSQILLPNLNEHVDLKNNPMNKDFNYKVVYNLKIENENAQKKRVITKILKLDENNQYGNGITKPLPTGCIKDASWQTFNFLLEKVDFEDKIGHLYIVDIEFDIKNATERELTYNEIYPPITEKQLLEQYIEGEKGPKSCKSTVKAHTTLSKKKVFTNVFRRFSILH